MNILLIDDRTERQVKFTKETNIKFEDYQDILNNITGKEYDELLVEFQNNNFDILDKYDVIITHRSAYKAINSEVLDKFKEVCKEKKKKLVFFSGGISSVAYLMEPFEFMLLNSKLLYSENLKLFFEYAKNNENNIKILAYGDKWQLNLLLNSLEKINLYIGKNNKDIEIDYEDFIDETNLNLINNLIQIKKPKIKNDFAKMKDIIKFAAEITNQIKQQVVLNV